MADLVKADVTYSGINTQNRGVAPKRCVDATLAFGDGAKTYPAGGVPLDQNKLGCPTVIEFADFVDAGNADGFIYKLDLTNLKIRIYQGDNPNVAAAPAVELGNVAVAAKTLKIRVEGW